MLTLDAAIGAADKAAGAVWKGCQGPQSFGWRDGLEIGAVVHLAQFVVQRRQASAEALYAYAVAGDANAKPWGQIRPVLRVSIETFRATLLVLLAEIERSVAVPVSHVPVSTRRLATGQPKAQLT